MFTFDLKKQSDKPYYEQIYEAIKREIKSKKLSEHTKLPSSRKLAKQLGISRSTVENAYAQLQVEGYIESVPQKGYYVCEFEEVINAVPVVYPKTTLEKTERPSCIWDFSPAWEDTFLFPKAIWKKRLKECISYEEKRYLYRDSQGDRQLRKSIKEYLLKKRQVDCDTEQIVIGAGKTDLLMILSKLLVENAVIAVENPGEVQAYQMFRAFGHKAIPVLADTHGICVEELQKTQANAVYVSPSHQFALGSAMPLSRKIKLLNWANYEPERYIIENDYDSELRYQGKPVPALQSMDRGKRVVYMGTFSTVFSPAIELSYMVLPEVLLDRYQMIFSPFTNTVSRLDQAVMARLITEGDYEKHISHLRNQYKLRHDTLVSGLKKFGDRVRISGTNAGLYVVLEWMGEMQEKELYDTALKAGILIYPLEHYCIEPVFRMYPTFLMGFAKLAEKELEEAVYQLQTIWK